MPILQKPIMKVNHLLLALFISNEIFLTFIFLTISNCSGLDHTKFLTAYLTLHTNFFHKMALQYVIIETLESLFTQKNHFCNHICLISCASQTPPNLMFQNQLNMQVVTPPLLIPTNLYVTKVHHKNLFYHQLHVITILKLLPQMTTHLSNYMTTQFSKRRLTSIKLTYLLTDYDTHLKTNLFYLLLQWTELQKLIIIWDTNQKCILNILHHVKTNHSLYWFKENWSMKSDNIQKLLKLSLVYTYKIKVHAVTLDSSSDTSPSAPSLSTNTESQTTTTTRNVTPVTPSKRTRLQITDTSSIHILNYYK